MSITIAGLVLGVTEVLEIYFVQQTLRQPASRLGILMMAMALGTLTGAAVESRAASKWNIANIFVVTLALAGLLLAALSRSTNLPVACVLEFVLAVPIGTFNILMQPLVMSQIESALIGRVYGVFGVVPSVAGMLSMAMGGVLVSTLLRGFHAEVLGTTFHPVDLIYFVSGLVLIVVAVFVQKPVRRSYQSMVD